MRVLALETATRPGSLALLENGRVVKEAHLSAEVPRSDDLVPSIDNLLKKTGWNLVDLDGIAVCVGPGSFTGIRVGIATAQGLSFALGKPVAGFRLGESVTEQDWANPVPLVPIYAQH